MRHHAVKTAKGQRVQKPPLRLVSADMADDALDRRRRGFWLWMARERKRATLADAARAAGMELGSASTISLYEAGQREVPLPRLKRLASFYGLPLSVFTDPQPTAMERLEQLERAAADLEREDWEAGERGPQPIEGDTGGEPRRRSA